MKSVCVFCGSSSRAKDVYFEAARQAGREMARRGLRLVYGGAGVGLMGALADAALEAGGEAVGVIPQALVDREVAHPRLTALHVVESMHDRKAMMSGLADAFLALPGGLGTLDELFETLTWGQLGLHRKPVALLNVEGYFDHLLRFCDRAVEDGFLHPAHRRMILSGTDLGALLDAMLRFVPPDAGKWWTRE
ncbi:MAG: TIGR00730 family Rossman fold protein [Bryobacteraceae bacterium]|nr:TIGR00730 family Rossman fold protein [Bryobacteraceae bacterium]MCX7603461.1 TIGR00730 family Rossman fold protein [Bryobacteraceae bacterium]